VVDGNALARFVPGTVVGPGLALVAGKDIGAQDALIGAGQGLDFHALSCEILIELWTLISFFQFIKQ
jgi:hypothetical protein